MNNKIINNTIFKLLMRNRTRSRFLLFRIITFEDFANLFMGTLFFIGIFLSKNIDTTIYQKIFSFNVMTVSIMFLFSLQSTNYLYDPSDNNILFDQGIVTHKKIKKIEYAILILISYKYLIFFQLSAIIYLAIKINAIVLLYFLITSVFIISITLFFNEIIKNLVLLISKKISFIYKIKTSIFTILFTVIYFLITYKQDWIFNYEYTPFYYLNVFYKLLDNKIISTIDLIMFCIYTTFFLGLSAILVFKVNIVIKHKNKDINLKHIEKYTYQKNSIINITNHIIKADKLTNTYFIEQTISLMTSVIWTTIILYMSTAYKTLALAFIAASLISSVKIANHLNSFLFCKDQKSLKYFEQLEEYNYKDIYYYAVIKILKTRLLFYILPLSILPLILQVDYWYLVSISYYIMFFGAIFVHYKYIMRHKPFSYSKFSPDQPSELPTSILYIVVFSYITTIISTLQIRWYSLLPILIIFSIFSFLLIYELIKNKMKYKYTNFKQEKINDCGIAVSKTLLNYYNKDVDIKNVELKKEGLNFLQIINLFNQNKINLNAYNINIFEHTNKQDVVPFIAQVNTYNSNHFVVVFEVQSNYVIIGDPKNKYCREIKIDKFDKIFTGNILSAK